MSSYSKLKKHRAIIAAILFSMIYPSAIVVNASETDDATNALNLSQLNLKYRAAPASTAIKDQYIVVFNEGFVDEQTNLMSTQSDDSLSAKDLRRQAVVNTTREMAGTYGAEVTHQYHTALPGFVTRMEERAMKYMMADPRISFIEQDQTMRVNTTQTNATWGLDRIDQANLPLNSTYVYDLNGSGVDAYILDTGILASHSNFGGRVASGFTAINDGNGTNDCHSHGTHVAGTVGSATYGVAKNVTLIPVRVLGCNGSGSNSGVIAGVDWVTQNASGPSVANMSLGGGNSTALDNAVVSAVNAGVTFVVAAGNSNANACTGSPNRVPSALTIASSTSSDARSSFSNWGSCVDMFAPGSSIRSTSNNGGNSVKSGTSMASPHVAGVAALYLQANNSASPAQVESALESAAAVNKISSVNGSPNLLVQTSFANSGVFPDPNKTYYIDNPHHNLRIGANGGEDAFTTSRSNTSASVQWKITASPTNGYYYIDSVGGGSKPRIRTDRTNFADMNPTTSRGTWTRWRFTAMSNGTYVLTTLDSVVPRLQVNNQGLVKMTAATQTFTWEQMLITEVQ